MKKIILICVFILYFILAFKKDTYAIYDPFSKTNNMIGIHILYPTEIDQAAELINSTGGDWGYVTIPIQVGDKNIEKWQKFMDDTRRLHVIPLVRLATEADYHGTGVWRKPTEADIVDFANFLNSLSWPTKNRYIILFNEVNRYDEWGGEPPNPSEYAQLVSTAVSIFKARSLDFYMILGGMDNAAPTDGVRYMNNLLYLSQMAAFNKDVFSQIDGFASHSYPNPNFAAPPLEIPKMGIASYRYEYDFINSLSNSKKPAFITETGWNGDVLPDRVISQYFKMTLDTIWGKDKDKIVAITPFLLASNGGFDKFSFYKNGVRRDYYNTVQKYAKDSGSPLLNPSPTPSPTPVVLKKVLGVNTSNAHEYQEAAADLSLVPVIMMKSLIKTMMGL